MEVSGDIDIKPFVDKSEANHTTIKSEPYEVFGDIEIKPFVDNSYSPEPIHVAIKSERYDEVLLQTWIQRTRYFLQNFNRSTETVFFREPRFFGSLSHSQKEESRLQMNHAVEDLHLQEPMKMPIEYGIFCVQIVS
ncbi:hypothetical protein NQ318_010715 [Aromia moschata]|uniref:Uncharacterized protein n=1 Tax=Aromia moschata TaxID=1265417 RepID=A0AAV8XMU4_9CUCU|nr:hypothetical protein NQ318_010715 [Aromia moschata]